MIQLLFVVLNKHCELYDCAVEMIGFN